MNTSAQPVEPKTTSRKYTRRSESQWRELIENFQGSDLSLEAYCQRHKIAASGFYTWRKRFESDAVTFRPEDTVVDITPELRGASSTQVNSTDWQVELELGRGCTLRIRRV